MNKFNWFGVAACLAISGCSGNSYIPMTQELRQQEQLTISELKSLQYFICPGLSIHFHDTIDDSLVEKGVLIQRDGHRDVRVELENWAPAVGLHATDNLVAVSLERGLALPFGVDEGATRGDYEILGRMNGKDFEVYYDGNWYEVQPGDAVECNEQMYRYPQLWVDTQALKAIVDERRKLDGRYVDEYVGKEEREASKYKKKQGGVPK